MSMASPFFDPRKVLMSAIIVCGAAFTACAASLNLQPTSAAGLGAAQSAPPISDADVPDSVLADLKSHLNQLSDLQEWVVLPADAPNHYTVSGTVELALDGATGQTDAMVEHDVQTFFENVYQSGVAVDDAHLYILQDGRVVAGAGLGRDAYAKLGAAVSTAEPAQFTDLLATQASSDIEGPEDCWYQSLLDNSAP
ncbi:hypothetical protein GCM10025857_02740 [Alicyclobacillus contaminans]|uniref:hypothetical protein n=1 Tax=Alicyclobacillus contaminans TaxID=392016 RepID=UPI00040419E4|nr:hypothetical protein [Alicyclobacillus contaminans]GMA48917.1 hypothetical protein GCM10025857_02740 [Alicyclobacillus contaminans]